MEEYPAPLVREQQSVVIGAVTETWELRWKAPPTPACEPNDVSLTCPCTGFAYGEGGALILVRIRNGQEVNRLELTPLFKGADVNLGDIAILQRWEPNYDTDFAALGKDGFLDVVARRPVVKIMDFVDYDHDGNRSEFYLKTDTLPCGKNVGVVVGISRSNQKLHVFGTGSKPTQPLLLQKHIWEALSRASGSVEVVDWPCGDHGSEEESTVSLTRRVEESTVFGAGLAAPDIPDSARFARSRFDCPRVLKLTCLRPISKVQPSNSSDF